MALAVVAARRRQGQRGGSAAAAIVPMEITFMDNGGNIFVLNEFI